MKKRIDAVLSGEAKVFSHNELDVWIEMGMPLDVVSIPNPLRVGTIDAFLVAKKEHPAIAKFHQSYSTSV